MIKLPCCNALSTRDRPYVRRVIDSLYCPDPCPRSQLTVPTFKLIPTSSRGVLLGVSEPSRITPRGRKFDVTFCNDCNLYLRRLLGKVRRGSLAVPWSLLRLTLLLRSSNYGNISFQNLNLSLSLGSPSSSRISGLLRWRVNNLTHPETKPLSNSTVGVGHDLVYLNHLVLGCHRLLTGNLF
jgi:hypothetical protein